MDELRTCQDCNNFCRHFTEARGKLLEVNCGHCLHRFMRQTAITQLRPACKHFTLRSADETFSRNDLFRDAVCKMQETLNKILLILTIEK